MHKLKLLIRALRLPFSSASILPFICGSVLAKADFKWLNFFLGLSAVLATHLAANLINDYADSKSGAKYQPVGPGYIIPMANNHSCGNVFGFNLRGKLPTAMHFLMRLSFAWLSP